MGRFVRAALALAAAAAISIAASGCQGAAGESWDAGPREPVDASDPEVPDPVEPPVDEVRFYHFDVGQADATLVWAPEVTVLIDAGDWTDDNVVPYLEALEIDEIDLMVFTHPHADHIGQAKQVIDNFEVTEVWMTAWEHTSRTYERTLDAVLASDAGYYEPEVGETQELGDVVVEVLNPGGDLSDVHDCLAVRVRYEDFSAIYTGDAEVEHEASMIEANGDVGADLLQLGHHGSNTSSSPEFLEAVSPEIAVYSAAPDSQYGHPHPDVVARIEQIGIPMYGTPDSGTILVTSNGSGFVVSEDVALTGAAAPDTDAASER